MNKENFADIATALVLTLIGLVLTGITFAVTYRLIMWILGA